MNRRSFIGRLVFAVLALFGLRPKPVRVELFSEPYGFNVDFRKRARGWTIVNITGHTIAGPTKVCRTKKRRLKKGGRNARRRFKLRWGATMATPKDPKCQKKNAAGTKCGGLLRTTFAGTGFMTCNRCGAKYPQRTSK